ncbi:DNA-binding transcriptional LysR family regulator [Neobacillus niacini]|uniref:LysR family transcriptional regulator n=1 Tax=Neobacillus niacini TaxID=86668 RepID=UPI002863F915|nr:LysR family transcriptional regulator [Neobacillus niacini]MDR7075192.1 DNA-binding transcriptional LysR family regulator [Neobacillus niacini]
MSLSIYNLKVLRMVYESESIKAVAEKMFVSQSAVSHQLRVMEEYLGVELFERKGRNTIPTKAGHMVYGFVVNILDEFDKLHTSVQDIKKSKTGEINIAGSINLGTYLLPSIVSRFKEDYPLVHLNLHVYGSSEVLKITANGNIDFCIVPVKVESEHLIYEHIRSEEIVLTISPNAREDLTPKIMKDLESLPFVCAPKDTQFRKTIDSALESYGIIRSNIVMEVGHPEGTKQAVRAGLGLGMNFRFVVQEEIEMGLLEEIRIDGLRLYGDIYLAYRPHKYFLPIEKKLINFIKNELTLIE